MKRSVGILLLITVVLPMGAYKRKCVDITPGQNIKDVLELEGKHASYVYRVRPSSFFTTGNQEIESLASKSQGRIRKCFVYVTMAEIMAAQEALEDYDDNLNLMVAPLSGVVREMADDLLEQDPNMTVRNLRALLVDAQANSNEA